jgi:hypothetical protein
MTEQVQQPQQEQEAPSLTLNDLGAMIQIIDVCSKRGGFEGPELESVGVLRNRLVRFVKSQQPLSEEGDGTTPPVEVTPTVAA